MCSTLINATQELELYVQVGIEDLDEYIDEENRTTRHGGLLTGLEQMYELQTQRLTTCADPELECDSTVGSRNNVGSVASMDDDLSDTSFASAISDDDEAEDMSPGQRASTPEIVSNAGLFAVMAQMGYQYLMAM